MTKKIKTSLVLSSLILGAVSLSADIINTNKNTNGIYKELVNNETIQNNAKISVTHSHNAEAIELVDVLNNSEIINTGTIEAFLNTNINNDDDAAGIRIDTVTDSTITNSGTITTNVNIAGSNSLSVGINPSELYNSTITNSGTIKSTIANKLDNKAMAIVIDDVKNSIITNKSSGKIYGNVVFLESDNTSTFKNEGFISLPYNANKNAKFISGSDTVSLQPSFGNLVNSGTIEIGAFKDSKGNIENTQIKTTNATFEAGSKMQVAVVSGSKAFSLNDTLTEVVKATNSLNGADNIKLNPTKLTDNSAILDFELQYNEAKKQIDLIVSKVNSLKEIEEEINNNQSKPAEQVKPNKPKVKFSYNAKQVDKAARKIGNEEILGKLQTVQLLDYEKALESLVPTVQLSSINSFNQTNSNISNIVFSRMSDLSSGMNSGDEVVNDNNRLWLRSFGSLGKQDKKNDIYGYDIKSYGIIMGYDKEYKEDQVLGFATAFTNAKTKSKELNHENDINAYSLIAYGKNLLKDEKTTIYYQASHTWQKNESTRELFLNENSKAKYTSKAIALDLKIGHKLDINNKVSIEPKIGLEYSNYKSPTIKEKGSATANLKTNKFNSEKLVGTIGADATFKIDSRSKIVASAKLGYDAKSNKNKTVSSAFVNNPDIEFKSKGINNGNFSYDFGLAYDVNINNKNRLNLAYKFIGEGRKFRNNILSVNYEYKF